jgi:hypothetical protein
MINDSHRIVSMVGASPEPSEEDRTAFHEAGHAIIGRRLRPHHRELEVSVRPVAGTLGHVSFSLTEEELDATPDAARNLVLVSLAGAAAETVLLGVPSELAALGAGDDEASVTYFLGLLRFEGDGLLNERSKLYEAVCEMVRGERAAIEELARSLAHRE